MTKNIHTSYNFNTINIFYKYNYNINKNKFFFGKLSKLIFFNDN